MSATDRVAQQDWYHSLDLPGGIETRGMFDLRPDVERYGLPGRMDGMRVLEVGTWDGFWAFEMERRGADVVALDLDDARELDWPARRRPQTWPGPRGAGFALAHEMLGSRVERVIGNVYDATPERLGAFDLVFCGSVLIHLRDQLLALERIAALAPRFIGAEEHDRALGALPFAASRYRADDESAVVFWRPNVRAWRRMLWSAGFDEVTVHGRFTMRSPHGFGVPHVVLHASR